MGKEQSGTNWIPLPEQIKLAELLLNPEDRRTKTEKMAEAGVPRTTFYRWLKDKDFLSYLKDQLNTYTDSELPDIWKALVLKCKRGDTQAIKLFMELKGAYVQKHEHTGKNGEPIESNVTVTSRTTGLSHEERQAIVDQLLQGGDDPTDDLEDLAREGTE